MVKYSVPELPPIIDTEINMLKSQKGLTRALHDIAYRLKVRNPFKINKAIGTALKAHNEFKSKVGKGACPDRVIDSKPQPAGSFRYTIGVIGHPYLLYDNFISMKLVQKLEGKAIKVITPEMIDPQIIDERCRELSKRMFWSSGKNLIGSALYIMDNDYVDGLLLITAFGCGVDSLAGEFIEKHARRYYKKPFMVLNVDEHTGDAGFNTRLEAFSDLLDWRNTDASYLSTHG